jgi:pimeloyl-ACP methyl ester carboxylesterase
MYPAGVSGVAASTVRLPSGVALRVVEAVRSPGAVAATESTPPAILLHGWGGSLYSYRHAFARMANRGLRAIGVDLRGFGLSDKPLDRGAYSIDAYCADIDGLLDVLGASRATFIGHSMGGGLSLRYAQRRPERVHRLALINPSALVALTYQRLPYLAPRGLLDVLGRRVVPRWLISFILRHVAYGDPTRVTERDVDEYWAPTQLMGFVQAAWSTLGEFDWTPLSDIEATALAIPTVVIVGIRDRLIANAASDEAAVRRLAAAQVHRLDGGHCVHEEQPEAVYPVIEEFITG